MSTLVLREAQPQDAQQIVTLYRQMLIGTDCMDDYEENPEFTAKQIKFMQEQPTYNQIVACIGDEIVGMCVGITMENIIYSQSPTLFIDNLVVSDQARRMGVATAMFKHIEDWGIGRGCKFVEFTSEDFRTGAHSLYRKLGYNQEYGFQKTIKTGDIK